MSSWFQRTPDPPRKRNLQRELSLEKQKQRPHPQLSPSLSAKASPTAESPITPTRPLGLGKHAPLCSTKSSPATSPERVTDGQERSPPQLAELQREIDRLKGRETALSKQLTLEKERRIKAEQLVEVERLALHEVQFQHHLKARKQEGKCEKKVRSEVTEGNSEDVNSATYNLMDPDIDLRESEEAEKTPFSMESFTPVSTEFNFSTSIFGQLTNDLQKILRVGETEVDPQATKSIFSRALDAVKSDNSTELQDCISGLRKEDGLPLLKLASEKGCTSCLRVLLATGLFDPSISGANGVTPLHVAGSHGQLKTAEILLEHGAPINATDIEGYTPLFLALRGSHKETAGMLIKAGSSLDVVSKCGQTLLHAAVMGHLPGALHSLLVRLRVHSGGTMKLRELITQKDEDHRTALHIAASRGLKSCTEVLCATGEADVTLRDRWNSTPIDIATGETKDILMNKDSKSVILYIKISPTSVSPTISHNTSYDLSEADEQEDCREEDMFSLAIGNLNILRHHTLEDLGPMVNSSLHMFASYINLRGPNSYLNSDNDRSPAECKWEEELNQGIFEVASKKFQLAKCFLPFLPDAETKDHNRYTNSDSGFSDNVSDGKSERMAYIQESKNVLRRFSSKLSEMEFTDSSVSKYTVGKYSWKAGMLPNSLRSKNMFNILGELSSGIESAPGIHIKLRGASERELDQLSLELMMPVAQLKDCIKILESEKKLLINGPHGNGKAHLARNLGRYLQSLHEEKQTQLINVYVDESFERDDLFRLFYSNHLLLPAMSEGTSKKPPAGSFKRHVLILNHLSSAMQPGLLSHIISLLESREAKLSLWVNEVPNRQEEGKSKPDVPGGLYYMKENCYVIGTWTSASGNSSNLPPTIVDRFPHVSMGTSSSLCCGVLRRQLLSASIHCANGVWPHSTQPLYRLMQWVGDIWILYNQLLTDLGLAYAPTGLKHFLSCPVSSLTPEQDILQWLISTWKYHIVPSVQSVLQDYFNQESSNSLAYQILSAIVGLAIIPTCPLSCEKKDEIVQHLCHHIEEYCSSSPSKPAARGSGLVGEPPTNSSPLFHSYHSSPSSLKKLSPLLGQRRGSLQSLNSPTQARKGILQRGTPLVNQRRGSWNDLRTIPHVTFEKPGKLVSYEDMVKNSPKVKEKFKKIKEETDSDTTAPATTISISPPEDSSVIEDLPSSPGNQEESQEIEPKSPTKEKVGNKLRKIRSKTISLFSRDGTGTLPRLFRRSPRAPLTSVTEEENKAALHSASSRHSSLPTSSLPATPKRADFTQSLDESNLSSTFNSLPSTKSSRYKSRRTPPPPPIPIQNGNIDVIKETRDTNEALQDLDEFLDLLTATPNDRIDKQRGSLPDDLKPSVHEDSGSDAGDEVNITVPKYYLPTNSSVPLQRRLSTKGQLGGNSLPAFSMPNLSAKAEQDHLGRPLKNYPTRSPYAYSTSHQHSSPEQHSPEEEPAGHTMYAQRSHDPRMEEGSDYPSEGQNYHRRYFSESSGYDVPRQQHSYHSKRPTKLYPPHHQYSKNHHKKVSSSYAAPAPAVGVEGMEGKQFRELDEDPDQVGVCGTWYEANGGGMSQDDGFLSPTKRLMDGEMRSPSPLAMTSYTSTDSRSPSNKYYTYHMGRRKRATVLQGSPHQTQKNTQEKARVPSPNFSSCRQKQEDICNGQYNLGDGRNSPIGRLDTWSTDWNNKERSKSVSHSSRHYHHSERASSGNTTVPPPLDILKKRASVSGTSHNDQLKSAKKRHDSTGSMQDMKANSVSDLTSPKALDSGALFGASLGFLGSSGSLNEVHAKM